MPWRSPAICIGHAGVAAVYYPGLEDHPQYSLARRQMHESGGMLSFELKGGFQAGVRLMERVQVATLAVSLGNADTLVQHPASMTQSAMPAKERLRMGVQGWIGEDVSGHREFTRT